MDINRKSVTLIPRPDKDGPELDIFGTGRIGYLINPNPDPLATRVAMFRIHDTRVSFLSKQKCPHHLQRPIQLSWLLLFVGDDAGD